MSIIPGSHLNVCRGIFRRDASSADASSAGGSAFGPVSDNPSVLRLVPDDDAGSVLSACSGLGDSLLALLLALAVESCAHKLFATWASGVFAAAAGRFLMNGDALIAPG